MKTAETTIWTVRELLSEMEDDIERYYLPLCFDPGQEQRELWGRHQRLQRIAERFVRMQDYKLSKKNNNGKA